MIKKKTVKSPKPRGVWKINPKSRVKPSKKVYRRAAAKKNLRQTVKDQT